MTFKPEKKIKKDDIPLEHEKDRLALDAIHNKLMQVLSRCHRAEGETMILEREVEKFRGLMNDARNAYQQEKEVNRILRNKIAELEAQVRHYQGANRKRVVKAADSPSETKMVVEIIVKQQGIVEARLANG